MKTWKIQRLLTFSPFTSVTMKKRYFTTGSKTGFLKEHLFKQCSILLGNALVLLGYASPFSSKSLASSLELESLGFCSPFCLKNVRQVLEKHTFSIAKEQQIDGFPSATNNQIYHVMNKPVKLSCTC